MNTSEKIQIIKDKDRVITYPEKKNTGQPIKDQIFNWVVHRYKKNNHEWHISDDKIFNGFIYGVLGYLGYVIFFALMWWIISITQKKWGDMKALFVVLLIILVRLNIMIKQLVTLNRKF